MCLQWLFMVPTRAAIPLKYLGIAALYTLVGMFLRNKAERLTNTALPALGCALGKASVGLIEVESNGTD